MNSRDPREVLIRPLMTEKTMREKEERNTVAFRVRPDANKVEIRAAVQKLWNVDVVAVRTSVVRGKEKRMGRFVGKRSNWKKAIVTIAPGQTVEFFEGV
jgi:large subunit ribosomal protein L23